MSEPTQEPFEQATPDPKPEPPKESKAISVTEQGYLQPVDHNQLKLILKTISEGGGMPKRFDTIPKQIAAYSLGRALCGDEWQLAVNHMANIHGQMMIYGELPRTLAERTKQVIEFRVYLINKEYVEICATNKNLDDEPYAAVADVQRTGRMKTQFTYSIRDAEAAGQLPAVKWDNKKNCTVPNNDSPWVKHLKVMLLRKAQALGVKFVFPESLVGAKIAEYDADELPDYKPVKDVTPGQSKASLVNASFGAQ